jgi:WhiB family redox-sensing transcriptional regulator
MEMQEDPEVCTSGSSWSTEIIIRDYWEWSHLGLCRNPSIAKSFTRGKTSQAKAVCELCPVKEDCLNWAIMYKESGIWGATSEEERKKKFSEEYRNELIQQAKLQGNYYSRQTPGELIQRQSKRRAGQ